MNFLLHQVKMMVSTAVIMTCALGGSIGMISMILAFAPETQSHMRQNRNACEEDS